MTYAHADLHAQIDAAGLRDYVRTYTEHVGKDGKPFLTGTVALGAAAYLKKHPQFPTPKGVAFVPALMHREIGKVRIEFRSLEGAFAPETTLQFAIGIPSRKFYTDLDRFNPLQGKDSLLKHNALEVWWPRLRRWFAR